MVKNKGAEMEVIVIVFAALTVAKIVGTAISITVL
jgi:hypothetical protein